MSQLIELIDCTPIDLIMRPKSRQPSNTNFSSNDLTIIEHSIHFIEAANGLLDAKFRDIRIHGGKQPKRLNNNQIGIKELLPREAVFVFNHTGISKERFRNSAAPTSHTPASTSLIFPACHLHAARK